MSGEVVLRDHFSFKMGRSKCQFYSGLQNPLSRSPFWSQTMIRFYIRELSDGRSGGGLRECQDIFAREESGMEEKEKERETALLVR